MFWSSFSTYAALHVVAKGPNFASDSKIADKTDLNYYTSYLYDILIYIILKNCSIHHAQNWNVVSLQSITSSRN